MVVGGKSHELVVQLLGVTAGQADVVGDGVAVHADQAGHLAGAHTLGIDPAKELYDGSRPVPITDGGMPIRHLFG